MTHYISRDQGQNPSRLRHLILSRFSIFATAKTHTCKPDLGELSQLADTSAILSHGENPVSIQCLPRSHGKVLSRFPGDSNGRGVTWLRYLCTVMGVILWCAPTRGFAIDAKKDGPLAVAHQPASGNTIPVLGNMMPITVELLNSRSVLHKVRLIGSKDGRLLDITFPRGSLNRREHPEFVIETPAPVAFMTYQFVIQSDDGQLTTSKKYIVKRDCIQNVSVATPSSDAPNPQLAEIIALEAKLEGLMQEATGLETSLKIIEELKSSLRNN